MKHIYNLSYWKDEGRRMVDRGQPSKSGRPHLKNKGKVKRTRGVAQVVESLLRKHKAMNSTPSTAKVQATRAKISK
jgi:hypothetical protein